MSDKKARIQALKRLCVIYILLKDVYLLANNNTLTKDIKKFRESTENVVNQIKAQIVEIGLVDDNDWKDSNPESILDWNKFNEYIGGYLGTIGNDIIIDIQKILDREPEIEEDKEDE